MSDRGAAYHIVHLGVAPMREVVTAVTASIPGATPDPEMIARVRGDASAGVLVCDWMGRVLVGSFRPATFAFATRRLRESRTLDDIDDEIALAVERTSNRWFGAEIMVVDTGRIPKPDIAAMRDAKESDETIGDARRILARWQEGDPLMVWRDPVTVATLVGVSRGLLRLVGVGLMTVRMRIETRFLTRRPQDPLPLPDLAELGMGSFFRGEILRLKALERDDALSDAVLEYIGDAAREGARQDLLASDDALFDAVRPAPMSRGRWPSAMDQPLVLGQQIAVSSILSEDSDAVVAVNGPPGTGKTTLLRDAITEMVVRRAERLADMGAPQEALVSVDVLHGDRSLRMDVIDPEIGDGLGIVVASSNNAAVENISREMPLVGAIDGRDFPQASYLPGSAAALATAFGENEKAWGLLALPMGRGDNMRTVLRALDGKSDGGGLVAELDALGPLSTGEWGRAVKRFRDLLKGVEKRIALCERVWSAMRAVRIAQASALSGAYVADGLVDVPVAEPMGPAAATDRAIDPQPSPEMEALEKEVRAALKALRRDGWSGVCPDATFFLLSSDARQREALWVDPGFDRRRTELFLAALDLSALTLRANAHALRRSFWLLRGVLTGAVTARTRAGVIGAWNTMFLVSPVMSTTLASVRRMPFAEGWLGLALIDESGQATPQSVLGLVHRAERCVLVGDPLQIEPVISVPQPIIERLAEMSSIEERLKPGSASAQSVADSVSILGTMIPTNATGDGAYGGSSCRSAGGAPGDATTGSVWAGLPLRLHRRCAEPMFGVANGVAYGGQMVQGLAPAQAADMGDFAASCWIDVRSGDCSDGAPGGSSGGAGVIDKVVPEEMAALRSLLAAIARRAPWRCGRPASAFVISPFVSVSQSCREAVHETLGREGAPSCPVGTVHAFQGREADIVIFVLGTESGGRGARSRAWASERPNLLNVALTRARRRVFVIGSIADWGSCRGFDALAGTMRADGAVRSINETVRLLGA